MSELHRRKLRRRGIRRCLPDFSNLMDDQICCGAGTAAASAAV
ncbi:hypothetical protein [Pirellulimonas nuda]|nr:hypothetical protein [Pirellulimonas nuda]